MSLLAWQQIRLISLLVIAFGWLTSLTVVSAPLLKRYPSIQLTVKRYAQNKWPPIAVLFVLIMLFCLAYSWLAITRHARFNSTGYDLAINEQIVWNTLNGRFFASSIEVSNSFADHFRPFLLIVLPFYALFSVPETLLIIQVIVLGSAAIPIYLLAKYKLGDQLVALAIATVYMLYPAVGFIARFDFHIEAFAIPAFIAAFYAVEKERWGWATFWLIIPLLCKENMGITVAMFGLYALIKHRKYRWGIGWLVLGLLFFWGTSFWLLPTIRGETLDAFDRYSWLGDTPYEMIATLFTNPTLVWEHIAKSEKLLYLMQLSLPVGFLAFLGWPELLLSVPGIATNLLADHFCQSTIYCQYTVPITPFIFISTIYGIFHMKKAWHGDKSWRLIPFMLVTLSFLNWQVDNPFQEKQAIPSALYQIDNMDIVEMALAVIPTEASVVTTNDYAPHLAQREQLYIIGTPSEREAPSDPDVVFFNLYDQQYIVCDQYRDYISQLDIEVYGVTFRTGGLIVIQRNAGSNEQFRDFVLNWNNCAG